MKNLYEELITMRKEDVDVQGLQNCKDIVKTLINVQSTIDIMH